MKKKAPLRRQPKAKPQESVAATPHAGRPFAPGYGIAGAGGGAGLLPWTWVLKQMTRCRTFWVATIHAEHARPHVMPVWGVWLDDAFFFSTGHKSRKCRNLVANPACTVCNDDGQEAVIVEGSAEKVGNPDALERVAAAYTKKYKMDPRSMGEPIFVVHPSTVFGFIEKSFPKSATRWKF